MAEIEWTNYLKTKDSRSKEYFKKKYGLGWEDKYNTFITNWSTQLSVESYIMKYGESLGREKYIKMTSKKGTHNRNLCRKVWR